MVAGQENVPEDNGKTDLETEFEKLKVAPARKEPLGRQRNNKPFFTKKPVQGSAHSHPTVKRPYTFHQNTAPKKVSGFLKMLKKFF